MEPSAPAEGLSIFQLVAQADPAVLVVVAILGFASLWSWATAIDKWLQYGDVNSRARQFERVFWSGQSLEDMDETSSNQPRDAMARVFAAASREWRDARRGGAMTPQQVSFVQERCDRLMRAQIQRETSRLARGLGVLATIGASAPFVGLFGTVWGIMVAFNAISQQSQTNLAIVAPGIAQALFATAMGLAAAIPSVIFYNTFSGALDRITDRLEAFSEEVGARLSRRLTERV